MHIAPLKKAWSKGTKAYWEQQVAKYENDKKAKKGQNKMVKTIKEELKTTTHKKLQKPLNKFQTQSVKFKNGSRRKNYVHSISDAKRLRLTTQNLDKIRKQLLSVLQKHSKNIGKSKFSIQIVHVDNENNKKMSTVYTYWPSPCS